MLSLEKKESNQSEWEMSKTTLASPIKYYYIPTSLYYGI